MEAVLVHALILHINYMMQSNPQGLAGCMSISGEEGKWKGILTDRLS